MTMTRDFPVLRTRDILAALVLLWLFAVAWDDSVTDDPSANIRLSFFIPQLRDDLSTVLPQIFDVDGDGSPEAMVAWLPNSKADGINIEATSWTLQVHDLRLAAKRHGKPFEPKILLQAEKLPVSIQSPIPHRPPIDLFPLSMTTGQVMIEKQDGETTNPTKRFHTPPADRTLQYFCGKDWHDAAEKCGTHCPTGQSSDCPENERCFADTQCDASQKADTNSIFSSTSSYHTTPAGGIPSVFTAWSGGNVTMHSITGEGESSTSPLQLKHMWTVSPFAPIAARTVEIEWDSVAMTFVDAVEAPNGAGMVVITGSATAVWKRGDNKDEINSGDDELDQSFTHGTFAVALDTRTGAIIWKSIDDKELEKVIFHSESDEAVPLPFVEQGLTSTARRRSHVARSLSHTMDVSSPNCMQEYRHSILTSRALPYQFWGDDTDTTIRIVHFDHHGNDGKPAHANKNYFPQQKRGAGPKRREIARTEPDHHSNKKHWLPSSVTRRHHQHRHTAPKLGKPNVVVTHTFDGIQVRALKNGRSLCHISLQPQTLYADINHDGKLDSMQVITDEDKILSAGDDEETKQDRQWIQDMVQRLADRHHQVPHKPISASDRLQQSQEVSSQLCQMLVLSGVPTMEELFNEDACGGRLRVLQQSALQRNSSQIPIMVCGAPLVLVESISGGRKHLGYDVVAATNIGVVSRYRGTSGRILWRRIMPETANGTLWDDDDAYLVQLGRLDATALTLPARPIVQTDRLSISILSAQTGSLLATAPLAEHPAVRPMILDLNGDGTSDILVLTRNAIWGYTVTVGAGASVTFRIIVGLLAMGLMLALLRNRFGQRPGKRGTDL